MSLAPDELVYKKKMVTNINNGDDKKEIDIKKAHSLLFQPLT